MSFKTKLLFGGALFSWLMAFLSWRFAHPDEITLDWIFVALILTVSYMYIEEKKLGMKRLTSPENFR
ncbi:MAG: hypothetical protein ACRD38_10370 [Nitrososphaerales archaeon]